MLEPQDRKLLTGSLRPPQGYELSWAVGTTFSMDLLALLTTPLSFALFDWETGEDQRLADPAALLEALRRYADRLTIFCQAGQISVPKPDQVLYVFLEDSVYEAQAPKRPGLFHPKIWVLRFEAEGEPVRYRVICLSRNLTFDRTWDTAVVLDGEVKNRKNAFAKNHPLAEFVSTLPSLARRSVTEEVRGEIQRMATELRRVSWELPDGFDELTFHPLGIPEYGGWPFTGRIDRMMVISPFLGPDILEKLSRVGRRNVLISRLEWLQEMKPEDIEGFGHVYVLDDAVDVDAQAQDEAPTEINSLEGLHAKVYVADAGWATSVWIGSANATSAAFRDNVEFMVELVGSKRKHGIDAILRPVKGETRLWNLLKEYQPEDPIEPDPIQNALDARVDETRRRLLALKLSAKVAPSDKEGRYLVKLLVSGRRGSFADDVAIRCWPIRLGEGHSKALDMGDTPLAGFSLATLELTSFFAFALRATNAGKESEARFVLTVPLEGALPDRREAALRDVLNDKERVLRFLLFLLADGDHDQAAELLLQRTATSGSADAAGSMMGLPLFEALVRALDRDPKKLDHVDRLIRDLQATSEGAALIPEGFKDIWDPIRTARERFAP